MSKLIKVAKYEYTRQVNRPRFWITTISVPLGMLLLILVSTILSATAVDTSPVGYLDQAGIITQPHVLQGKPGLFNTKVELLPYADRHSAELDVENGVIQGFVVIPEGYELTYQLTYFANKQPDSSVTAEIISFISDNLMLHVDSPNLARVEEGSHVTLESLDGMTTSDGASWQRIIVPIVVGILYFILVMSSGGYLLQALIDEKENRTMEMMITSVSPNALMGGKILGNISIGFTQILVWAVMLGIGAFVFRNNLGFLGSLDISWSYLAITLAMMLVAFVFAAAWMAIIGSTLTGSQESSSLMGIIVLPVMLPFYMFSVFMNAPNGTVARILSYIPLSSPLAVGLRMAFTNVPAWEIASVFAVLILLTIGSVWLAGRAFRIGMLQYSKRIPLRELFRKEVHNA